MSSERFELILSLSYPTIAGFTVSEYPLRMLVTPKAYQEYQGEMTNEKKVAILVTLKHFIVRSGCRVHRDFIPSNIMQSVLSGEVEIKVINKTKAGGGPLSS